MSEITLRIEAPLIAAGESSGFDVRYCDETLAVELFLAWHRSERARIAREAAADARRRRFRVVPLPS